MLLQMARAAAITGLLTAIAGAQSASYTFFGTGCTTQTATFQVVGTPQIGTNFTVQCLPPVFSQFNIRTVLVLTGASDQTIGGVPLPFDTSVLSGGNVVFCGNLLTSSELVIQAQPSPGGSGLTDVVFPIPMSSSLIGVSFYQQVLESNQQRTFGNTLTHTLSQGGHGVIGL